MAERAQRWDQKYPASVGLVVGATYPEQLARIRGICPELPILLPGVGAQEGQLEASVKAGIDADGLGLYLSVKPAGTRSWVFRFMLRGRAREMGLGPTHTVSGQRSGQGYS